LTLVNASASSGARLRSPKLKIAPILEHPLALIGQVSPRPSYCEDALPVRGGERLVCDFFTLSSAATIYLDDLHACTSFSTIITAAGWRAVLAGPVTTPISGA
jgi:hypothetical protein